MADNPSFQNVISSVPSPVWEIGTEVPKTTFDGTGFIGRTVAARVGILPDGADCRVQYGRVMGRTYRTKSLMNYHGWRVRYFSSWDGSNAVTGTGYAGGSHGGVSVPRLNNFPVQKSDLAGELVYEKFYRMANVSVWNGLANQNISVPVVTGSHIRRMRQLLDHASGGSFSGKRYSRFSDNFHSQSIWFARIAIWENGRIIGYSPTSEPLFIQPNALPFNEQHMAHCGNVVNGVPDYNCDYLFLRMTVAIGENETN